MALLFCAVLSGSAVGTVDFRSITQPVREVSDSYDPCALSCMAFRMRNSPNLLTTQTDQSQG